MVVEEVVEEGEEPNWAKWGVEGLSPMAKERFEAMSESGRLVATKFFDIPSLQRLGLDEQVRSMLVIWRNGWTPSGPTFHRAECDDGSEMDL